MWIKQEIILLLCCIIFVNATQTRISVTCDRNGFACRTTNSKSLVIYQCPSNIQDVKTQIWGYGEPSNTAWVLIKNCKNVEIDLSCTIYRRSFESLTIENVENLVFTRTEYTLKHPIKLILKNISYIETIPENTFSISRMVKYHGEASQHELQEIEFDTVKIGTIEIHAFHSLQGFRKFLWKNVEVDRIHANAIKIRFNTTEKFKGTFSMLNSSIEIMEYLSFQLYSKSAVFIGNKFVEIMSGGINGTLEHFEFSNNVVNTLESGSISILSKNVKIMENNFENLKSGSLEKISPGLLVDSHTNFGLLEFEYEFSNNTVHYLDAGSLNPDVVAYEKVSTKMSLRSNRFFCTCENMGWFMSPIGHGFSSQYLKKFYKTMNEEKNDNTCLGQECHAHLFVLQKFLRDGKCHSNLTLKELCREMATPRSSTMKDEEIIWFNRSDVFSKSNSNGSNIFLILILSSFSFCFS